MRKIDVTLFPYDGDSEDIIRKKELESKEIVELAKVFAKAYARQIEITWMIFEYDENEKIRVIASTDYYGELEFAEDLQMEVFGEIKYGFPVD